MSEQDEWYSGSTEAERALARKLVPYGCDPEWPSALNPQQFWTPDGPASVFWAPNVRPAWAWFLSTARHMLALAALPPVIEIDPEPPAPVDLWRQNRGLEI